MAREFTPEELGISSTPQEYTSEELGLSPTAATKKEFTPEELGLTPTVSAKPEDVGMLTRAKQALTEGFESLGGAKRGIELGSAVDNKDMTAAAAKMQDIKTKGQVAPAVQTLSAADIQRIAEEKGLIPAGMQVPSFVVEQILKSGPEMVIPLLTGFAASAGTAAVTGPAAPLAAPIVGALVGIGTYGVQQYGHFMERQALEKTAPQDLNPTEAKKWAAITAPLGYAVDRLTLGMGKVGTKAAIKEITKEIAERGTGRYVAKAAGEGAIKGLSEVPTEVLEQAAERYQAGLSLDDDQAKNEYFEAGWGALAVGTGLGGVSHGYQSYKEAKQITSQVKEVNKAKEKILSDDIADTEVAKPNRKDVMDATFDEIKTQADAIKAKQAKPKVKVKEEEEQDLADDEPSSVLNSATLTSLGFKKSSNGYKALIGKDISAQENRDLLNQVIEANPDKVNEDVANTFIQSLPPVIELKQPKPIPKEKIDVTRQPKIKSEADRTSLPALDESKRVRATPEGVESSDVGGVDATGDNVGQPVGRETQQPVTLKEPKAPEAQETLKSGEVLGAYYDIADKEQKFQQQVPQEGSLEVKRKEYVKPEDNLTPTSFTDRLSDPDPIIRDRARTEFLKTVREGRNIERSKQEAELLKSIPPTYPLVKQGQLLASNLTNLKNPPPQYLIDELRDPILNDKQRKQKIAEGKQYIIDQRMESVIDKILNRPPTPQEVEAFNKLQNELFRYEPKKLGKNKKSQFASDKESYNSMIDAFIDDFTGLKQEKKLYSRAVSPELTQWFEGSKLVDDTGAPLKLYHGTTKDVKNLKSSKDGSLGAGIYLTPDPAFASRYAEAEGGNVLPVITNLKNPLVINTEMGKTDPMIQALTQLGVTEEKASDIVEKAYEEKGYISKEVMTRAQKQGYDGIVQYKDGKLSEIVAFNATQVKSTIDSLQSTLEGTPEGKAIVNTTRPAKTLGQALTIIRQQHLDKLNPVQKILLDVISKLPNVTKGTYKVMGMKKGEYGLFEPFQNKTTISPDAGVDTIFHEATHSATAFELKKHVTMKNGRPVGRTPLGNKLVDIFDVAEVAAMQQDLNFGEAFKDMDEFIANAYNTEAFQKFLASERSVVPDAPPVNSLWTDFLNFVKQLLNLGDVSNTLLSDVVGLTPDLFTGTRQVGNATIPDFTPQDRMFAKDNNQKAAAYFKNTNLKTEKVEEASAFKEFKDDPKQFVRDRFKGWQHFLDTAETNFFSSDAGLSNAIRRGLEENAEWAETKKVLHSISTSQALHSEAPAHQFLEEGDIKYDPSLHKYVVSKSNTSWKKMMLNIKALADKAGIPYETMEKYAHAALIGKRLNSLKEKNKELKEDVLDMMLAGKDKEAKAKWEKEYKHIHMTTKEINNALKLFDAYPGLNGIVDQWNSIRAKVLKFGVDSGLYSAEQAQGLLDVMDYVPFYRVEQIEQKEGPKEYTRGLLDRAKTDPRFKGSNQPVNNVFDNMERWMTYVIRKGINNKAAQNLVAAADQYLEDEVTKLPPGAKSPTSNTIGIWQNGGIVKYRFEDPLFVKAFTGMETVALPAFPLLAKIANVLRENIVLYPLFSISQVFQDTYSALITSGVENPFMIPIEVAKEIYRTATKTSATRAQLKSVGAVGIRDYTADISRSDAEIAAGLKKPGLFDRIIRNPLQKFSMASDNVIRQAIYNQTLKETGDKALAIERAFEVINFRRTGSNKLVSVGRQVIPFFGAYLQSLNVMMKVASGRGIAPSQRAEAYRVLRNTMMKTMLLSLIYSALVSDDDDYEKLDPSVRDRRFIFPGMGGLSIPLRSDLATLFTKIIPEHLYHTLYKQDEDGTKAGKAIKVGIINAIASPSVMPQAFKPLVEASMNYDYFTGRPIAGTGVGGREDEMQYTARTSELAKVLGSLSGSSPMKIDHLLDGYLGYSAGLIRLGTNNLMADIRGDVLPSNSTQDLINAIPGTSAFYSKEFGNRAKNDYYELRDIQSEVYNTYKYKEKFRGPEETLEYINKDNNKGLIARKGLLDDIGKYLGQLRAAETRVLENKNMSPDEKQQKIRYFRQEEMNMLDHISKFEDRDVKYIQKIRFESGL